MYFDVTNLSSKERWGITGGTSQLIIDNAEIVGRIETAGGAVDRFNLIISQSSIDTGGNLPCIEHNASNAVAFEVLFISTQPGDVVTGAGNFLYNNLAYFYSAYGIPQTLAATAVPIGTENAYNLIYRTTEGADWTDRLGSVPLNVNFALDSLVDEIDTHIDRTDNPHSVTLTQLGGIAVETDPTVTNWVKDGVTWTELKDHGMPAGFSDDIDHGITNWNELKNYGMPEGFSDDVDDVGLTSEDDPEVGYNVTHRVPRWDGSALVYGSIYDPGTGKVGVGMAPVYNLDVNGDARVSGVLEAGFIDSDIADTGSPFLHFEAYPGTPMTVIVPAEYGFRVTNHANSTNNLELENDGDLWIRNDVYAKGVKLSSDSRAKVEGQPLDYGLAEVLKLHPERYLQLDWTQDIETGEITINEQGGTNDFGLVAQDVYEIIPEAVTKPEDETKKLWYLEYDKLIPVLIKGMQELHQIIEDQDATIDSLEKRIEALEARMGGGS